MNNGGAIDEFDNLCDKVRFAVSVDDELDSAMLKHIDGCEECRTFLKQSEIMVSELKNIGLISLNKHGKTVADSVMEEIAKQEIFTKGTPLKNKTGGFRRMGLIAACAVIAVMALPLVRNGIFGSKDTSVEYVSDNGVQNEAKSYENALVAVEEGAASYYEIGERRISAGAGDCASDVEGIEDAGGASVAKESAEAEAEAEIVTKGIMLMASMTDAVENSDVTADKAPSEKVFTNSSDSSSGSNGANEPNGMISQPYVASVSGTELYSIYETGRSESFENVEDAAMQGALLYCDGRAEIIEDSLEITYTDGNTAYAVLEISGDSKITVYLRCIDDMWTVLDVCDGDITE